MSMELGQSLQYLRKKKNFNQRMLCQELCSASALSRFEYGEQEPDRLLLDALFGRLGVRSDKWEIILQEPDKLLLKQRIRIEHLMMEDRIAEVKKAVEEYRDFRGVTHTQHQQFYWYVRAKISSREGDKGAALEYMRMSLGLTRIELLNKQKPLNSFGLSEMELKIFCSYCELLGEVDRRECWESWEWLELYMNERNEDKEFFVEFQPLVYWNLSNLAFAQQEYGECLEYCRKGLKLLKEYRKLYLLKEFLVLEQNASAAYGTQVEEIHIELLGILKEIEAEDFVKTDPADICRPYRSTYSIGEILKNTRHFLNKKQEDFNEYSENSRGRAATSTLSKIENGHSIARKSTCEFYFERLGLHHHMDLQHSSVQGERFEIQEMRWEIERLIGINQKEKAEVVFDELVKKLDLNKVVNKQFVIMTRVILERKKKGISSAEYRNQMLQALKLTWEDCEMWEEAKLMQRYLTDGELVLLINIANSYHEEGNYEHAIELFNKISDYFRIAYEMASGNKYQLVLVNYSQALGMAGRYDESIEVCEELMSLVLLYQDMGLMDKCLYNMGWNYGKKMLETDDSSEKNKNKNACQKYFRQALCLSNYFNDKQIVEFIENKMKIWF